MKLRMELSYGSFRLGISEDLRALFFSILGSSLMVHADVLGRGLVDGFDFFNRAYAILAENFTHALMLMIPNLSFDYGFYSWLGSMNHLVAIRANIF